MNRPLKIHLAPPHFLIDALRITATLKGNTGPSSEAGGRRQMMSLLLFIKKSQDSDSGFNTPLLHAQFHEDIFIKVFFLFKK